MSDRPLELNGLNIESLARELLTAGNSVRFRAKGSSMRPFIRAGDLVEIIPVVIADLRRGDVLLFGSGKKGQLMLHRLVQIRRKGDQATLILQGDANRYPDGAILPEQVIGRAVAVKRKTKQWHLDGRTARILAAVWVYFSPAVKRLFYRLKRTFALTNIRARIKR